MGDSSAPTSTSLGISITASSGFPWLQRAACDGPVSRTACAADQMAALHRRRRLGALIGVPPHLLASRQRLHAAHRAAACCRPHLRAAAAASVPRLDRDTCRGGGSSSSRKAGATASSTVTSSTAPHGGEPNTSPAPDVAYGPEAPGSRDGVPGSRDGVAGNSDDGTATATTTTTGTGMRTSCRRSGSVEDAGADGRMVLGKEEAGVVAAAGGGGPANVAGGGGAGDKRLAPAGPEPAAAAAASAVGVSGVGCPTSSAETRVWKTLNSLARLYQYKRVMRDEEKRKVERQDAARLRAEVQRLKADLQQRKRQKKPEGNDNDSCTGGGGGEGSVGAAAAAAAKGGKGAEAGDAAVVDLWLRLVRAAAGFDVYDISSRLTAQAARRPAAGAGSAANPVSMLQSLRLEVVARPVGASRAASADASADTADATADAAADATADAAADSADAAADADALPGRAVLLLRCLLTCWTEHKDSSWDQADGLKPEELMHRAVVLADGLVGYHGGPPMLYTELEALSHLLRTLQERLAQVFNQPLSEDLLANNGGGGCLMAGSRGAITCAAALCGVAQRAAAIAVPHSDIRPRSSEPPPPPPASSTPSSSSSLPSSATCRTVRPEASPPPPPPGVTVVVMDGAGEGPMSGFLRCTVVDNAAAAILEAAAQLDPNHSRSRAKAAVRDAAARLCRSWEDSMRTEASEEVYEGKSLATWTSALRSMLGALADAVLPPPLPAAAAAGAGGGGLDVCVLRFWELGRLETRLSLARELLEADEERPAHVVAVGGASMLQVLGLATALGVLRNSSNAQDGQAGGPGWLGPMALQLHTDGALLAAHGVLPRELQVRLPPGAGPATAGVVRVSLLSGNKNLFFRTLVALTDGNVGHVGVEGRAMYDPQVRQAASQLVEASLDRTRCAVVLPAAGDGVTAVEAAMVMLAKLRTELLLRGRNILLVSERLGQKTPPGCTDAMQYGRRTVQEAMLPEIHLRGARGGGGDNDARSLSAGTGGTDAGNPPRRSGLALHPSWRLRRRLAVNRTLCHWLGLLSPDRDPQNSALLDALSAAAFKDPEAAAVRLRALEYLRLLGPDSKILDTQCMVGALVLVVLEYPAERSE